jgi:energy-coupling factor transport system permease protein
MSLVTEILEIGKTESPIHSLNPVAKSIWWLCLIIVPIIITNPIILALITLWVFIMSYMAHILRSLARIVRIIYPTLIGFIVVVWPFFYPYGENVIIQTYFIKVTWDGIIYALAMGLRIVTAVTLCFFFVMTNDIGDLASSLGQFAQKNFKVSYTVPLMVISSFKFLPEFMAIYATVKEAFMSRAVEFEKGSISQRIKAYIPVFITIILSSLDKAKNMAIALELKAFGAKKERTFLKPNVYSKMDYLFAISGVVTLILSIYIRFWTKWGTVFFWR